MMEAAGIEPARDFNRLRRVGLGYVRCPSGTGSDCVSVGQPLDPSPRTITLHHRRMAPRASPVHRVSALPLSSFGVAAAEPRQRSASLSPPAIPISRQRPPSTATTTSPTWSGLWKPSHALDVRKPKGRTTETVSIDRPWKRLYQAVHGGGGNRTRVAGRLRERSGRVRIQAMTNPTKRLRRAVTI